MTDRAPALPAPTPGLIASLNVRVWLEVTENGQLFAPLLLTHPPARRDDETELVIRQRMLGVAAALGLDPAAGRVPDTGARLTLAPRAQTLLHFDGLAYKLRLPTSLALSRVCMSGA